MRLWKRRRRWDLVLCFPAESDAVSGESAFVTIERRPGEDWAYVGLEGIDETAVGVARTAGARVFVVLVDENEAANVEWENPIKRDFDDALARVAEAEPSAREALERARKLVLENERGRLPVDDSEGLTAFGSAFSKLSATDPLQDEFRSADPPL